jgi:hypothetical protein
MTNINFAEKIDYIFAAASKKKQEELRWLLDTLRSNHENASRAVSRTAFLIIIVWVSFYAISVGLVEEVGVVGLKIQQINALLVAGPVILGFLAYRMGALLLAQDQLLEAISEMCRHLIPELVDEELEDLIAFPSYFAIERAALNVADGWYTGVALTFTILMGFGFLFLPVIAFIHVTYLLFQHGNVGLLLSITATLIGAFFAIRGGMLWFMQS